MKRLPVYLLLTLFPFLSHSQDRSTILEMYEFDTDENEKVYFQRVVMTDKLGADSLQKRSAEWMLSQFYEAGSNVGSSISYKGDNSISAKRGARVIRIDLGYSILIEHKHNRTRITFANLTFEQDMLGSGEVKSAQPAEGLLFDKGTVRWIKETRMKTAGLFLDLLDSFERFHLNYKKMEVDDDW